MDGIFIVLSHVFFSLSCLICNFFFSVTSLELQTTPTMSRQPIFVESLQQTTEVVESAQVRLEVLIVGNPPPKVMDDFMVPIEWLPTLTTILPIGLS